MCIDMHTHTRALTREYTRTHTHTRPRILIQTQVHKEIELYRDTERKWRRSMRSILAYALTHIFTLIMDCLFTSRLHSLSLSFNRWSVCVLLGFSLLLSFSSVSMLFRSTAHTHTHIYTRMCICNRVKPKVFPSKFSPLKKILIYTRSILTLFLPFSHLACL